MCILLTQINNIKKFIFIRETNEDFFKHRYVVQISLMFIPLQSKCLPPKQRQLSDKNILTLGPI